MKTTSKGFLTGKLLIATPAIGDPRFDRTLILLCDHSNEHAMGIVLNKPVEGLRLPDLFRQLGVEGEIRVPDTAVLDGGPVDRDRGFVLHTAEYANEEATLPVGAGLGLTATREILTVMASPDAPGRSLLALGYAGWGEGQLEDELAANAWLVAEPDEALIFGEDHDAKWANALKTIGVDPERLSAISGTA